MNLTNGAKTKLQAWCTVHRQIYGYVLSLLVHKLYNSNSELSMVYFTIDNSYFYLSGVFIKVNTLYDYDIVLSGQ